MMPSSVDNYLKDGCMRCKFGATPACKVNTWRKELKMLRKIVLKSGLTEEVKWGVPCYTSENKNIVTVSAFNDFACLSFFKGVLLSDSAKILVKPGESSQSARLIKYTNTKEISAQADVIFAYIQEAIQIEKAGKKVEFKKNLEPIPTELLDVFKKDSNLKNAFYALTPGRQRGYIIYISQAKQSQSKISRIEKCRENILHGVGLNDKYSSKK